MKKVLSIILGVLFIVIGVAGIVLPIVPGWVLILFGVTLVAPRFGVRLRRTALRKFFRQETLYLHEWSLFSVRAGFTTKHFPLLLKKTDDLLDLSKQNNFKRMLWKTQLLFQRDKASEGRFVFLNQVHGDRVMVLDDEKIYSGEGFYHLPEADGVLTNIPNLTLLVMTADCLSIFFCVKKPGSARSARWVGLVHAGWRGTRERIAVKALELLCERAGCEPADVRVAFGPAITCAKYEVGEEFEGYFKRSVERREGKLYFDLTGENRRQLLDAGIKKSHLIDTKICTVGENSNFYSYRKEKDSAGRTISFVTKL